MPVFKAIRGALYLIPVILFLSFSACNEPPVKQQTEYDPGKPWKLVWADEFDGDTIDTNKWSFEKIAINMEQQTYTETNAFISNGNLVILATRYGNVFYSSRLNSLNKFSALYGKIVARIRVPFGTGMWPAFWMLGTNLSSVNWPQCGEIDIMEERGGGEGDRIVYGTSHWYADGQHVQFGGTQIIDDPLSKDFHIYELEWDDSYLRWKIDNDEYNTVDIRPDSMEAFHHPFYIILNLAVGGMFSRIYSPSGVTAPFPQTMLVDWVRVYQR
jgi:beta-glucanase (GH16 family)